MPSPRFSKDNQPERRYTPVQLKTALVTGFMEQYSKTGRDAWRILAHENPEGFLRLGAYLAPKELQLDVFMAEVSDPELDAMIDVLRAKVRELGEPMKQINGHAEKVEATNARE